MLAEICSVFCSLLCNGLTLLLLLSTREVKKDSTLIEQYVQAPIASRKQADKTLTNDDRNEILILIFRLLHAFAEERQHELS